MKKTLNWNFDLEKIKKNAKEITILHDETDQIVPETAAVELQKKLGGELIKFKALKPHIKNEQEPEVLSVTAPSIKVFTTRPDTIFGATYMVVAPEHPLIKENQRLIENYSEVAKYVEEAKKKKEMERTAEGKEKTGVELKGFKAVNPATGMEIPIWTADYVLWGYGTGAIMAVPAHDQRDFEFAKKFGLPIAQVVDTGKQETEKATAEYGAVINSGKFDGMKTEEAISKMAEAFGRLTVQYKLRDWVFSRQRYWGEPIPLIHCPTCGTVPVPDSQLPVKLPPVKKYEPTGTGESPLAAIAKWVNVKCPVCKGKAKRETNTMPQWAGSSWYWLRYADPKNKTKFADKKKLKYWQPVDVYFGGMEHTTLHLLYSRFWNLFLYDQGLVTEKEPYKKRQPHGIVLAADGEKMSKSRGNVVDPQVILKKFGADTLRMYEMFLGPHELMVSWNDQGVVGVRRFLDRVWQWAEEIAAAPKAKADSPKAEKLLHRLVKKVGEDIENFRFNTAISAFMEFHNEIKSEVVTPVLARTFLKLLYPFAPHISEELNQRLGGKKIVQSEAWPKYDKTKIAETEAEIVVQVNGKVRGKVLMSVNADEAEAKQKALDLPAVKQVATEPALKRVIYIKGRLINLVV
ncbi:MAG: class I tRNA ligase family protein [Patescibacteria group bacterium]|nr:class I tRNA ligase family protein [Patescibacteria group bacterium]